MGGTGVACAYPGIKDAFNQIPCPETWPEPAQPTDAEKLNLAVLINEGSKDVAREAMTAILKYPNNSALFISLLQESGELATQLRARDRIKARTEAIQVAALALRIAVQDDADGAEAFDPLREITERDHEIDSLKQLLREAQDLLIDTPLDENGCPLPCCENCGARHEVVRPGKTQPTCLCDVYQREVEQHKEAKDLVEAMREKVKQLEEQLGKLRGEQFWSGT